MLYIKNKDIRNIRVCVNLVLDKYLHLELDGPYKQRPTYDRNNSGVCDNPHKDINEGLQSFQLVLKKYGK